MISATSKIISPRCALDRISVQQILNFVLKNKLFCNSVFGWKIYRAWSEFCLNTLSTWYPSITDGVHRNENLVEKILVFSTFSNFFKKKKKKNIYNYQAWSAFCIVTTWYYSDYQQSKHPGPHGLRTPGEEITLTARPKIHSQFQIFCTAKAYFVCHIWPIFQISLIFAFIGFL